MLFWLSSVFKTAFSLTTGTTFTMTACLKLCGLSVKCTPYIPVFECSDANCGSSWQVGDALWDRALLKKVVTGVWLWWFRTWTPYLLPASSLAKMYGGEESHVYMPAFWRHLPPCCPLTERLYHLKRLGRINPSFLLLLLTRHLVVEIRKVRDRNIVLLLHLYFANDFVLWLMDFVSWHQSENYIIIPETMYPSISSHKCNSVNNVNLTK